MTLAPILSAIGNGWTPGAVGIWVLVGLGLLGFWKGLPAVLDAWSNSASKEREHREREISRLEAQIKASDDRHAECMEGQKALRDEITAIQKERADERRESASEYSEMQKLVTGLIVQMRQMQLSAVEGQPMPALSSDVATMLSSLERNRN